MQIYFIILLFLYTHEIVEMYNVFLVMYFASYSNKSMSIRAFLFSDTKYLFSLGLLWVSNRLSMNVCSQTNVVKEM